MTKHLIPHKFTTGDTISTRAVNENILAVDMYARELLARRYHRFCVLLDFGDISTGVPANMHTFKLDIPFAWDLVSASLFTDETSVSEDMTLSISSGSLAFSDPTIDSNHSVAVAPLEATESQGISIPANQDVTLSVNIPASGSFGNVHAVLECRYDCLSLVGAIPDPPLVKDGDTISATAVNTWITDMTTVLTAIQTGLGTRKWFEVQSYRTEATTRMIESARLVTWAGGEAVHYDSGGAGTTLALDADYYDAAAASDVYDLTPSLGSANTLLPQSLAMSGGGTVTSAGNDGDDIDDRNQIDVTITGAPTAGEHRVIIITYMEAS